MNAIDIFDALNRASDKVHLVDERRKKREQLYNCKRKVCGNCYHWMKSSCYQEKQLKQFKSCGSIACSKFELDDAAGFIPRLEKELLEIQAKIDAMCV